MSIDRLTSATRRRIAAASTAVLLMAPLPAGALDFACVEPSRYRHLQQIFQDDPNVFFSYFRLERRQFPQPDVCRALIITGTLGAGAADALLDRVIAARGWLGYVYLAFGGDDANEEAKLAGVVRQFALKTYFVRGPNNRYHPDFALRWRPVVLPRYGGGATAAEAETTPLDKGLASFMTRGDLVLKLDNQLCTGGCRSVWAAGVNRLFTPGTSGRKPAASTTEAEATAERIRTAIAVRLDRGKFPPADDPFMSRPLEQTPATPPAVAAMMRQECSPEMTVAEGLETRVSEVFNEAAKKNLAPPAVAAIAPHLAALNRAGARLQQCHATVLERLRLASFQKLCPKACDKAGLSESFSKTAQELVEQAGQI